jgi:hypothetical protein
MQSRILRGTAIAIVVLGLAAGIAQAAGAFDRSVASAGTRKQVLADHFSDAARAYLMRRGRRGPRGPRGFPGAKGAPGVPGAQGPKGSFGNITYVLGPPTTMCAASGGECSVASATATCPAGTTAIAGGEIGTGIPFISAATSSTSWSVTEFNEFESSQQFRATAVCAS